MSLYFFKNPTTGEFTLDENIKSATPAGYYERKMETVNGVEVMSLLHVSNPIKSKYKLPLSEFKKADGNTYASFDELIAATQCFFFRVSASEVETPYTGGVVETKTRTANQNQTYAGTVRAVPSAYSTLTAAYTAAVHGDIIEIAPGTYNLSAESGGYWLVNTATKGVLVRSSTGNSADVTLVHSSNATYGIRLRDCLAMQFEGITFQNSGTFSPFTMEQAYASVWVKFKNCILNQTSGGASGVFGRASLTSDTDVVWIEFDNCIITSNGTITPIQYSNAGVNETLLVTRCSITATGLTGVNTVFDYKSDHKGLVAAYDNVFTNSTDTVVCQFGSDESVPTNTTFKVDFRNNILQHIGTHFGHSLLLGRGTNKVYCVNNLMLIPATSNTLAIGLVIKTAATAVNDSYIAGNYSLSPRPMLIKGGQNNIVKFNTMISNYPTSYYGLDISNPEATRLASGNVVRFNNFYGGLAAIATYDSTGYEDPETTIKGWTMNNNRYYSTLGESNWMNISSVNKAFYLARTIFQNNNDCYSKFVSSPAVIISKQQIYDPTSTISW